MSPDAAAIGAALAYAALLLGRARAAVAEAERQDRLEAARPPTPAVRMGDVAVLQPILSGDAALETVLKSALLALPDARFVWLVDDDDALVAGVVARLRAAHPDRRIRTLACPAAPDGVNPKAFKLEIGWRSCTEGALLVLDDDAAMSSGAVASLVAALDRGALACALPHHAPADDLPSALLAAFIDDNAAMTYLAPLGLVGPVSINGMAYAIRRATLERLGGFDPILHHLADDLGMATMLHDAGLTIVQSAAPVEVRTTLTGWDAYARQMHRWYLFATLLMRVQPARVRCLAIALQAVHPPLLWTLAGLALLTPSIATLGALASSLVLRSVVLRAVHGRFAPGTRERPGVSALAELLQPVHLLHATLVRTIRWRTRTYRVHDVDDFRAA